LSLGLVFVTVVLGRWLLDFAGVAFAIVTFGGGGRVFSFFVLVLVLQRSGAGPAICLGARGARISAAHDAALSNRERGSGEDRGVAAAIRKNKLRVRLRRVRLRAGFEPQRASSFMKRVKASQILGEAARA
jgi:hypothetical protein